jgi:hypothetical protein
LLRRAKTGNMPPMDQFQPALDLVLGTLKQIRADGARPPRASRTTLAALHRPIQRTTAAPAAAAPTHSKVERLAEVRARVAVCELCPHLAASRTQVVFGTGNPEMS